MMDIIFFTFGDPLSPGTGPGTGKHAAYDRGPGSGV